MFLSNYSFEKKSVPQYFDIFLAILKSPVLPLNFVDDDDDDIILFSASKETQDLENDNISELSVATKEKRNRSRFAKLIRKISAPSKNSTDNHVQRKATTPEPVRKAPLTRTDRSEIYATPSATRRLFSLSNNRRQRERTTSDTEIMKYVFLLF